MKLGEEITDVGSLTEADDVQKWLNENNAQNMYYEGPEPRQQLQQFGSQVERAESPFAHGHGNYYQSRKYSPQREHDISSRLFFEDNKPNSGGISEAELLRLEAENKNQKAVSITFICHGSLSRNLKSGATYTTKC